MEIRRSKVDAWEAILLRFDMSHAQVYDVVSALNMWQILQVANYIPESSFTCYQETSHCPTLAI